MKFSGIKTIDELIKYADTEEVDEDILIDMANNITVLFETIQPLYASIVGPDYSVGIMGPSIEEIGGSIQTIVKMKKENALSLAIDSNEFIKVFEKIFPNALEDTKAYNEIQNIFTNKLYTDEVKYAGFSKEEVAADILEGMRANLSCALLDIDQKSDPSSVIVKLEISF